METINRVNINDTNYNVEGSLLFIPENKITSTAGSSTSRKYLATKLKVTDIAGITTPQDGLTFAIRIPIAGASGGLVLSIDDGQHYYPIVRNVNTAITTQYPADSTMIVSFNSTQTATTYLTSGTQTTVTGCWQIADYDSNTKTSSGTSNKVGTKMYLIGGTSQSSSGITTYTNKNCYIGTDNCLYSNGAKVATTADLATKQDKITGTAGQFVVIGSDGNPTTMTITYAEEGTF